MWRWGFFLENGGETEKNNNRFPAARSYLFIIVFILFIFAPLVQILRPLVVSRLPNAVRVRPHIFHVHLRLFREVYRFLLLKPAHIIIRNSPERR